KHLAEHCRAEYSKVPNLILWILAESAIVACDIPEVIDKAFGFDIAVEEAQCAINAAHVDSDSIENGIGLVKLMGRYSGYIAMYGTLASRDVDCCLIPESPFYLKGPDGLFDYIEKRLEENGHMVIVIAECAGQQIKGVGGVEYA
ncbi:hypothetical protein C3L33_01492, partial [Rhododendron williamsianum]